MSWFDFFFDEYDEWIDGWADRLNRDEGFGFKMMTGMIWMGFIWMEWDGIE